MVEADWRPVEMETGWVCIFLYTQLCTDFNFGPIFMQIPPGAASVPSVSATLLVLIRQMDTKSCFYYQHKGLGDLRLEQVSSRKRAAAPDPSNIYIFPNKINLKRIISVVYEEPAERCHYPVFPSHHGVVGTQLQPLV